MINLKWFLPILLLPILFGCGTSRLQISEPPTPPRSKPVEAMEPCGPLPPLREDLPQLDLEEALKEVIRNKGKADERYRVCMLRHAELVRWIQGNP